MHLKLWTKAIKELLKEKKWSIIEEEKYTQKESVMAEKYHIVTYGCQMNVHESEKIAGILRRMGYEDTAKTEDADIIVFNTCCIS